MKNKPDEYAPQHTSSASAHHKEYLVIVGIEREECCEPTDRNSLCEG